MRFITCEIFYCLIYWLQWPILGKEADQLQAPLKTTMLTLQLMFLLFQPTET